MKLSLSAPLPSVEERSSDNSRDEREEEEEEKEKEIRHREADYGNSLIY